MSTFIKPFKRKATYIRKSRRKKKTATRTYVNRRIAQNSEYKYHRTIVDSTAATSTGIVYALSHVAEGDDQFTRNGIVKTLKSLRFAYSIKTAGNTAPFTRVVIVLWKGVATPVPFDIVAGGVAAPYVNHLTPHKLSQGRTEKKILYDRVHTNNNEWKESEVAIKNCYMNTKAYYSGPSAASAQENHLYVLFISGGDGATGSTYQFESQIRFVDS